MNYTLIPFSSSIFLPKRNINIKNCNIYKDFKNLKPPSLKLSKKALGLKAAKVDIAIYRWDVAIYSLPSEEFKYFSWSFNTYSQKTENKQQVCPESIHHKKYLKLQFQLQINMASYKFKSKYHFVEM